MALFLSNLFVIIESFELLVIMIPSLRLLAAGSINEQSTKLSECQDLINKTTEYKGLARHHIKIFSNYVKNDLTNHTISKKSYTTLWLYIVRYRSQMWEALSERYTSTDEHPLQTDEEYAEHFDETLHNVCLLLEWAFWWSYPNKEKAVAWCFTNNISINIIKHYKISVSIGQLYKSIRRNCFDAIEYCFTNIDSELRTTDNKCPNIKLCRVISNFIGDEDISIHTLHLLYKYWLIEYNKLDSDRQDDELASLLIYCDWDLSTLFKLSKLINRNYISTKVLLKCIQLCTADSNLIIGYFKRCHDTPRYQQLAELIFTLTIDENMAHAVSILHRYL